MSRKRKPDEQRQTVQFVPPAAIAPYVGRWIRTTISGVGNVVAYVINYHPATGMVDMWVYRPGSARREFMQYHYSDLIGIGPYYGPVPPYPSDQVPPPPPPSPYPLYPPYYPPYQPYPPYPVPRRSCQNYTNRSQQLACLLGLIPPI